MKYYVIAGEASGDLHGSNLLRELKQFDRNAIFRCWGGDLMKEQGAVLVKHYRDLAFMGFAEVVRNLPVILRNLRFCKEDIQQYNPDVLILIDYPGFNLRIAKYAHANGIRVFYYISPQVWAWKQSRVYKIRRWVDRMFVILPFEKEFYRRYGMDVSFVGHPLLDALAGFSPDPGFDGRNKIGPEPVIALLPGSRAQEIEKMLPVMLRSAEAFTHCQVIIAGAPSIPPHFYHKYIVGGNAKIVYNQTYDLLSRARVAAVTSGTATLETGLLGVPFVVCYKGGRISYLLARQLIKVKFVSLVNLILDRSVVKELIQDELTEASLGLELRKLLEEGAERTTVIKQLDELKSICGGPGASRRAASEMWKIVSGSRNK